MPELPRSFHLTINAAHTINISAPGTSITTSNAKLDDPEKLTLAPAPLPEAVLGVELAVAAVCVALLVEDPPAEPVMLDVAPDAVAVAVAAVPVAGAGPPHWEALMILA